MYSYSFAGTSSSIAACAGRLLDLLWKGGEPAEVTPNGGGEK